MKRLYFVRHGLSVANQQGIFSGQTETPLATDGHRQAHEAGLQLKDAAIDCIVSSPLIRTLETAQIIAKVIGFPPQEILVNQDLEERGFGPYEGTPYQPNLGDEDGVETAAELIKRIRRALEYIQSLPYDNILVVSHGAVGRALRHCIDPQYPFHMSKAFGNAKVVKLYDETK